MKPMSKMAICSLLCLGLAGAAGAQKYTVTDLGVLSGDSSSIGDWINNSGQIVGCSDPTAQNFPCAENTPGEHAFLWTKKKGLLDLGTLPGGSFSQPYAINDSDEVVGYSDTTESSSHGFRWFPKTGMHDLGTLAGGTFSVAAALNSKGEVVGWSDFQGSSGQPDAVLWDVNGNIQDLGKLSGSLRSSAGAINNNDEVVGTDNLGGGVFHAFYWTAANGMVDLGTQPGGSFSFIGFINNSGLIVGGSDSAQSPGVLQCVLWDTKHKIHQIGSFTGGCGLFDMSDKNEAVGQGVDASGNGFAISWSKNAGVRNLNNEIAKNSGWTLTAADSVNNFGQIVGWGVIGGETHAFLLTPK